MAENRMSNTMEINSILEEARISNRTQTAPARRPAAKKTTVQPAKTAQRTRTAAKDSRIIDDGFVDISSASYNRPRTAQQSKPKKKNRKPLVISLVVVLVLAIAGVGGFMWYRYQNSGSSTVVTDNVFVNGIDLGGKTMDEAKKAMTEIENSLANAIKVEVKAGDKSYMLTKDDFSYTFNTNEVMDRIKVYSEEKSLNKDALNLDIAMNIDTSGAETLAEDIAKDVHTEPADARVSAFDSSASQMFTFQDEKTGQDIDAGELADKINGVFKGGKTSGSIEMTVKTVEPKLTAAYLKSNIVKLSSFSTYSTNNSNGNENMRVSLNACDSSIIEPGETWSFNDCTGNSNLESNGYKPAGVIVQGRSETGIGGGICQSSTTIYNAGLLCGMDVVERACHYYKSTYVDAGLDATIDYGNIDLKLKNPFSYQLFMKCWMDGTELNCEIYGLESDKFDDIKLTTSDASYFSNGYTVKTYRTFYKNGKEVDKEELPSSTYYTSAPGSGSSSSGSSGNDSDDSDDANDSDDSGDSSADSGDADADAGADAGDAGADAGDAGADADAGAEA